MDKTNAMHLKFVTCFFTLFLVFMDGELANAQCNTAPVSPSNFTQTSPQISCDGTDIVWTGFDGATRQIYKNGVQISFGTTDNLRPQISCDGKVVVWEGTNANGERNLYKNGNTFASGSTTQYPGSVSLSCEGNIIAWSQDVVKSTGTYAQIFRNAVIQTDGAPSKFNPQISCDGSQLIWRRGVVATSTSGFSEIYKNGVYVSTGSTSNGLPVMSCDGSKVLWSGTNITTGTRDIFLNGAPIATGSANGFSHPVISCDGTVITWVERIFYPGDPQAYDRLFKNGVAIAETVAGIAGTIGIRGVQLSGDGSSVVYFDAGNDRLVKDGKILDQEMGLYNDQRISLDGNVVVWTGYDPNGFTQIYIDSAYCSDGDPQTINDAYDDNCQCVGTPVPCVPGECMFTAGIGDWDDPSSWACNTVPTQNCDVIIPDGQVCNVAPGTTAVCKTLCVEDGAELNIPSTSSLDALGN